MIKTRCDCQLGCKQCHGTRWRYPDDKLTIGERLIVVAIVITVIGLIAAAVAILNYAIYGDWTCMFANCRKIVP
jgi:hypothetical protein